jgi:hypothetical protein
MLQVVLRKFSSALPYMTASASVIVDLHDVTVLPAAAQCLSGGSGKWVSTAGDGAVILCLLMALVYMCNAAADGSIYNAADKALCIRAFFSTC